ncbi:hypothetical protein M758_3G112500 [Ceratodon purpureus]|nr:hypothetical protein M758_3G112500 [Ceratodon purpureus]
MSKAGAGAVVDVSDDDDDDFEPLPLNLSQVRPGQRKIVKTNRVPSKTPPVVKKSPYFSGSQSAPSKSLKLQRPSSSQRRASENFASGCVLAQCDDVKSTPIGSARSGKDKHVLSSKLDGEADARTTQSGKATPYSQVTPSLDVSTGKLDVAGSSPANPVWIGKRLQGDDSAIASLTARFNAEESTSAQTKRDETPNSAADQRSPLRSDAIEGAVRVLGEPKNGPRKRRLCKLVDRIPDDSGAACTPQVAIKSEDSGKKRTRKAVVRDVKNSTDTTKGKGAMLGHDDICKEEVWEEDFAAFATRNSSELSAAMQLKFTAALSALDEVASKGQILHVEKIPSRPAAYTDQDFKLPKKLQKALQGRGVEKFYTHQAEAMDAVFNGSSIVAATPTASGKSMTYIIPVLDSLMKVPKSRALFIFPVKALARDQLKILSDLVAEVKKGSHCYCYDGDTNMDQKSHIRKTGKIILTNPDMLHHGILPHHKLWEQFFSNLKFVVIDEAHTYRGIFGSHVGCILRRLLRIARHYGSEPMFICCSATIANPKEHVKRLTTIDMDVIHGSGAPAGEKHVLCWLPPETKNGERRSVYKEAVKIVVALMKADLQILVFVEARKSSEIVCKLVRQKLAKQRRIDLVEKVDSYRAGYTQEERIVLEKRLQDGQLRALVTTRALELGIDVGNLDATVHVGLPDTMCSLWQQAGRAGRRQGASLAVILGRERALDVFYMKNPKKLFSRDVEQAVCNPTNPYVLRLQLPCAANELPLNGDDVEYFGEDYTKIRDELVSEGILQYRSGPKGDSTFGYRYDDNPGSEISIRGISANRFQLFTGNNELVEELDEKMALRMLYDGAIYPHARDTYRIKRLDIKNRQAYGELYEPHHMTEVNVKIKVRILEEMASRVTLGTRLHLGKLEVVEHVMGYSEYDLTKNKLVETVNLKYPPSVFNTVGLWWDFPAEVMQKLKHMAYEALLVLKRVTLPHLASMTMSDANDMLGLETLAHEQTEQPQIFLYDAFAGGIGIAEQAFKAVEHAWRQALYVLQTCDCKYGCPACTLSASETVNSEANSSKHAAILLIECLLSTRLTASNPTPRDHANAAPRVSNVQAQNPNFDGKPHVQAVDQRSQATMPDPSSNLGPYMSALKGSGILKWQN